MVLSEKANPQARVLRDEAGSGLQLANQQFQDRSFACTVGTNDSNTRIELDIQIDVLQQRVSPGFVAERDIGHLDYGRGKLLDFGKLKVYRVFTFGRLEDRHFFEFLDSRLSFRGFGGIVTEFVNKSLEMGALGHLVFIFTFGGLPTFFFSGVEGV